jgi:tRNA(Glu) U13 pseudouridine synthase TruD
MLEELQRRNFAATTITTYLKAVEQFARHFNCRPDRLNHTHLRTYQAYLLRERKLTSRTVRLHVAALRFFFVKTLKRRYLLDDTPYPKAPRLAPRDPQRRRGHAVDRRRGQSRSSHDADGLVLDRHAECGAAPAAGLGHR